MSEDTLKKAIKSAKESKNNSDLIKNEQDAIAQGLELVEKSAICMLGTNGEKGFPNIKAMMNLKHEGLKKIWFSTNTSSRRVQQLRKDNRACVYYVDETNFKGLMLVGTIEILQDIESRKMLWSEGAEVYYPLGVEDPDYSVLCFTARQGNYYQELKNITFKIE
ncbi:MAG TPA: pyridoxamine 5'-phosphate oxidase family protein [Dehalococcoidales bacterium]|nr:pyridoxamine 5'-phosphate oxidase family protein [Dehalococcoidales bacterium]